jgi:hypothetical protein
LLSGWCSIPEIDLHLPLPQMETKKSHYQIDSGVFFYWLGWLMGLEPTTTGITISRPD